MTKFIKWQPKRVGLYTQKIVSPIFKARGLMEGRIITQWENIVGERYAKLALPEKIVFPKGKKTEGTLYLSVTSSGSLLLHYVQGLILEQINTFYGYKAIAKLYMNHGFTPPKGESEKAPPRPFSPEENEWVENQIQSVTDPDLKIYLEKLGKSICR